MMYGVVMLIHIFVSFVLIGVILLQAGKGGLAETMGGSTAQSILGTSAGTFLTRATAVCAILFMVTCISLTMLSSRHEGSLILRRGGSTLPAPMPLAPRPLPGAPVSVAPGAIPSAPAAPAAPTAATPAGTPTAESRPSGHTTKQPPATQ